MNTLSFAGELGPDQAISIREKLAHVLSQPRPRLEIDLSEVTALHLGIVNVIVTATREAEARLGSVYVVVAPDTEAHHTLSRVGIVATVRP